MALFGYDTENTCLLFVDNKPVLVDTKTGEALIRSDGSFSANLPVYLRIHLLVLVNQHLLARLEELSNGKH